MSASAAGQKTRITAVFLVAVDTVSTVALQFKNKQTEADMLDTVPQKAEAVGPLRALQRAPTRHSCAAGHRTLVKTDHLSGTKRLLHEQLADFSLDQSTGNEKPRERN